MNAARPAEILRHLEQSGAPDAELLARFAASKDAAAFAELVRRHGALVFGVCRRVTGHVQDAEDAFQATFLVLAKKAGSLRNSALLGNWLYGVAFRVAARAKRSAARRRTREVTVSALPDPPAASPAPPMPELAPILDEELAALPEHYRAAIVLCDLRGISREEAAAVLGVPEGTLSSRLATGRKKLAARLTKRGITLSAAALPVALADVQAATAVPAELISTTSGLVADWVAGAAVPGALARLTQGGFSVRKMLVLGAVMVVGVAGAVFAAHPRDEAPPPADPPIVVEKPVPAPEQKDEKAEAFASAPKLRTAFDMKLYLPMALMWNPTGTHIAVHGRVPIPVEPKYEHVIRLFAVGAKSEPLSCKSGPIATLVAVARDGQSYVTDLHEPHLISGQHRLNTWSIPKEGTTNSELKITRTLELEPVGTHVYAFASDGKTYRTLAYHPDDSEEASKIEVLEVNATTGKTSKSLLKVDYGEHALSQNGKRLAVLSKDVAKVTVYDVDRGTKAFEYTLAVDKNPALRWKQYSSLVFSPDARRLVVARGIARTQVLNTDTGEALPELEDAGRLHILPEPCAFSSNGRLFASVNTSYQIVKETVAGRERSRWDSVVHALTVWDTQTGKVLKTWKSNSDTRVAFSPARPVLAVVEQNSFDTRIGFWDFAAEVEKK